MPNYTDELIAKLIDAGIATPGSIAPCTEKEISSLEAFFSVTLPITYKDFLRAMGKGAGSFMSGIDFFYPQILDSRDWANETLKEWNNPFMLSPTDFVFLNHGGQFMFFDTTTGSDPPIRYYKESAYESKLVNDSFSSWLETRVNDSITRFHRIKDVKARHGY